MKVRIALTRVSAAMRHALIQAGSLSPVVEVRSQARRSDAQALASDWAKIGRDLHRALKVRTLERAR